MTIPATNGRSTPTSAPSAPPEPAAAPPPPEDKPTKKAKPIHLRDEFGGADKDNNGKLNKSELKLADRQGKVKDYDRDEDGKVDLNEYRAEQRRRVSFDGLDQDGDEALSAEEIGQMRRFTSEEENAFDGDGDGTVTRQEFLEARRVDRQANRDAIRREAYDDLSAKERKQLAKDKRYDGDKDGKVSEVEFLAGRKEAWRDGREAKIDQLFKKAGGKDGSFEVKDAKRYKGYDANEDGKVTKDEFEKGQLADREAYWEQTNKHGEVSKELKSRLGLDKAGFGLNRLEEKKKPERSKERNEKEKTVDTPAGPMVKRDGHLIHASIAEQFDKMSKAAKKDGIDLSINSAFRTYAEQKALYEKYGPGRAAAPGTSNHEDGKAIDFLSTPGAYDWLARNATQFGFHNLPGEPWHYSLDGH